MPAPEDNDSQQHGSNITGLVPCRMCGRLIYDQADECPYCKKSMHAPQPTRPSRVRWAAGAIAVLAALVIWLLLR